MLYTDQNVYVWRPAYLKNHSSKLDEILRAC